MDPEFFDEMSKAFGFGFRLVKGIFAVKRQTRSFLSNLSGNNDLMRRVASLQQNADQLNHHSQPRDNRKFVARINRP